MCAEPSDLLKPLLTRRTCHWRWWRGRRRWCGYCSESANLGRAARAVSCASIGSGQSHGIRAGGKSHWLRRWWQRRNVSFPISLTPHLDMETASALKFMDFLLQSGLSLNGLILFTNYPPKRVNLRAGVPVHILGKFRFNKTSIQLSHAIEQLPWLHYF